MRISRDIAILCLVLAGACGKSARSADDAGAGGASAGGIGGSPTTGGAGGAANGGSGGGGNIDGGPSIVTIDAGTPTTLATGEANGPWDIAVDATHVYWTDTKANAVMKVPKAGGATVTLASDQTSLRQIAVGGTNVYWTINTSTGSVMKVPAAGGTPTALAAGQYLPTDIAADATSVYWATQGNWFSMSPGSTVMKASLDTDAVTMLISDLSGAGGIAVDAAAVYWTRSGEGPGTILSVPLGGGEGAWVTRFSTGYNNPLSLASDGNNVYFTNFDVIAATGGNTVMKVAAGGGTPTVLVATVATGQSLVVDGATLYWASRGKISRMSVEGGTLTEIPTGDSPSNLVVDRTHLYWTSAEGRVMALAKP